MKVKNLQSWDELENELQELEISIKREGYGAHGLRFRGQPDGTWSLKTTLERFKQSNKFDISNYYSMMRRAKSRIETFTGTSCVLPEEGELYNWLEKWSGDSEVLPALEYMTYLRHHGFPSPLLDWSRSPFVAAYFAFRDVFSCADSVAIYAYTEMWEEDKGYPSLPGEANIKCLELYVTKADRRHFLQQSTYTVCTRKEEATWYFCNHEEAFTTRFERPNLLWKFILPSSERKRALEKLERYNINAYSLFQSEDSILETILLRDYLSIRYF